jgi:hypothetical protein
MAAGGAGQFMPQRYGGERKKNRRKVALPPVKIFGLRSLKA